MAIPFYPLTEQVVGLSAQNHEVAFTCDDAVVDVRVSRCAEVESRVRRVYAILTNTVGASAASQEILRRMMDGRLVKRVQVKAEGGEFPQALQ